MTSDATGSTHTQRRAAQKIKSTWVEHIKDGTRSLSDLAAASQQSGKEGDYLAQIRLVDLLSAVHPGLTRAQIIAELEPLPIKTPADPARFSVRSIRSRDELVAQVQSMLQTSAMTRNARGRTDVPTNWPWGTKLSDLIRLNGGEMPQGLEWLESGAEADPGDLLLAAPEVEPLAPRKDESKNVEPVAPKPDATEPRGVEPEAESASNADDTLAALAAEFDLDDDDAKPETATGEQKVSDPLEGAFADILGEA